MIREHLFHKRAPADPLFRWRGGEISRIEGLSDAVFAFALALIVVSLEVPRTYDDLLAVIRTFPAFAVCFALLMMCWYYHYKFFRRYGLEDFPTILLNTLLLFVILFYVYPLKFLFTALINPPQAAILAIGGGEQRAVVSEDGSIAARTMMTVTMSCDHRVIDGALGARFLGAFRNFIEEPAGMLL